MLTSAMENRDDSVLVIESNSTDNPVVTLEWNPYNSVTAPIQWVKVSPKVSIYLFCSHLKVLPPHLIHKWIGELSQPQKNYRDKNEHVGEDVRICRKGKIVFVSIQDLFDKSEDIQPPIVLGCASQCCVFNGIGNSINKWRS